MNSSSAISTVDPSVDLLRRSQPFRWYWAGQSLSFLGSHVAAVALPLVAALSLNAGPAGVAAVATASMLPNLLFSLIVGNWEEGRDHRRIMIPADLLRAGVDRHRSDRLAGRRAFAASLLLSCFAPLLLAVAPLRSVALAVVMGGVMLIAGLGLGNANVYSLTLRQTVIPRSLLARSGGAYRQVMYGSIPIGSALAGVVGEVLGPRTGVLVGAVGLALSALPMFTRRIRALREPSAGTPDE